MRGEQPGSWHTGRGNFKHNPSSPVTSRGRGHLQMTCGAARVRYISESQGDIFFYIQSRQMDGVELLLLIFIDLSVQCLACGENGE